MRTAKFLALAVLLLVMGVMLSYLHAARKPHSVTLTWQAAAGAVHSYNIYRGTTSGGPYVKIASSPTTRYVDTPVPSGAVFYYVVTSVVADKESAYSQEIKAAVP
jgi:fibronectin type 3 domain-containing protein